MRKYIAILSVFVCLVFSGCASDREQCETPFEEEYLLYATEVSDLPENFVSVEALHAEYSDILEIGFFESVIYALDQDGNNIWQTTLDDSDAVLYYNKEHYIHTSIAERIVEDATHTAQLRRAIYGLGDVVELDSGKDKPIYLTIGKVVCTEDGESDCNIYTFYYTTENYPGGKYAPELFVGVETDTMIRYDDFFGAETGCISIRIPMDETPERLLVHGDGQRDLRSVQLG